MKRINPLLLLRFGIPHVAQEPVEAFQFIEVLNNRFSLFGRQQARIISA
jgi:hypothetical protein